MGKCYSLYPHNARNAALLARPGLIGHWGAKLRELLGRNKITHKNPAVRKIMEAMRTASAKNRTRSQHVSNKTWRRRSQNIRECERKVCIVCEERFIRWIFDELSAKGAFRFSISFRWFAFPNFCTQISRSVAYTVYANFSLGCVHGVRISSNAGATAETGRRFPKRSALRQLNPVCFRSGHRWSGDGPDQEARGVHSQNGRQRRENQPDAGVCWPARQRESLRGWQDFCQSAEHRRMVRGPKRHSQWPILGPCLHIVCLRTLFLVSEWLTDWLTDWLTERVSDVFIYQR